jgi:glycine oxidase
VTASNDSYKRNTYDAVIVGAGVIGLSIAWRTAQHGLDTLVVEAEHPAAGATGVAAGMLAPVTEATFGEEDLLELNLEAARAYPSFVAELESETEVATGYRSSETLAVAVDRDQAELLEQLYRFQVSLELDVRWLKGSECRELEPALAPRVVAGVRAPLDHQVRPDALARGLVAALERAGGELRTGTAVESLVSEGGRVSGALLASGEEIVARSVVVAAGWRSGALEGVPDQARVPVRPVKGQVVRLAADPHMPLAGRVVRTPEVYIVPRGDGEVVVGATVEERGEDASVTAGGVFELLRAAYEALPGMIDLPFVDAAAGLRPASPDNKPIVGEATIPGLIWATAHWRNGILLAPVTADGVAALLAGEALGPSLAPFSPERFVPARAPEHHPPAGEPPLQVRARPG